MFCFIYHYSASFRVAATIARSGTQSMPPIVRGCNFSEVTRSVEPHPQVCSWLLPSRVSPIDTSLTDPENHEHTPSIPSPNSCIVNSKHKKTTMRPAEIRTLESGRVKQIIFKATQPNPVVSIWSQNLLPIQVRKSSLGLQHVMSANERDAIQGNFEDTKCFCLSHNMCMHVFIPSRQQTA